MLCERSVKKYKKRGDPLIGLVTANWCLVGRGYNQLVLCSSEKAHLDYKRALAESQASSSWLPVR